MATYRLKMYEDYQLEGFIKTLTSNGYEVTFREGGNARILMCDVADDKCKIRESSKDASDFADNETIMPAT